MRPEATFSMACPATSRAQTQGSESKVSHQTGRLAPVALTPACLIEPISEVSDAAINFAYVHTSYNSTGRDRAKTIGRSQQPFPLMVREPIGEVFGVGWVRCATQHSRDAPIGQNLANPAYVALGKAPQGKTRSLQL